MAKGPDNKSMARPPSKKAAAAKRAGKTAAAASGKKTRTKKAARISAAKEPAVTITLGPAMDLVAATALKDDFLEVTGAANGMGIDAAEVKILTTPCVQIIVAAGLAMAERKQDFSIDNASHAVRAAFEDLGLRSEFGRWSTPK